MSRGLRLLAPLTCALLAAACNALTGVGDFTFDAAAASTGARGEGGRGGDGGKGGEGGVVDPDCKTPGDCPDPGACRERACVAHKCAPKDVDDGEDCSGGRCFQGACVACVADADCSADACDTFVCSSKHTCVAVPRAKDTPCYDGGDGDRCDGAGNCVACNTAADCGGTECTPAACNEGSCSSKNAPNQMACADHLKCDANGHCKGCLTVLDCPDAPACNTATCALPQTFCQLTPDAIGAACSGGVCDGTGKCVACNVDADCGTDECATLVCEPNHTCRLKPSAPGAPCSTGVCDGGGACVACVKTADCAPPGPCIHVACEDNLCVSDPLAAHTACGTDAAPKVCTAQGTCVGCVDATDCGAAMTCTNNSCK